VRDDQTADEGAGRLSREQPRAGVGVAGVLGEGGEADGEHAEGRTHEQHRQIEASKRGNRKRPALDLGRQRRGGSPTA